MSKLFVVLCSVQRCTLASRADILSDSFTSWSSDSLLHRVQRGQIGAAHWQDRHSKQTSKSLKLSDYILLLLQPIWTSSPSTMMMCTFTVNIFVFPFPYKITIFLKLLDQNWKTKLPKERAWQVFELWWSSGLLAPHYIDIILVGRELSPLPTYLSSLPPNLWIHSLSFWGTAKPACTMYNIY